MLHRVLLGYQALFADPDRRGSFQFSLTKQGDSVAFSRLVPFPQGTLFVRPTFSPSEASIHHVFKKEGVSCGKKAVLFFVACDANPDTRVKIPDAMRINGYSPSEAADRSLQMQVCREADKIKGEAIPKILMMLRMNVKNKLIFH